MTGKENPNSAVTVAHAGVLGTPSYMAPEQHLQARTLHKLTPEQSQKIDVYAFGVLLWELFSGVRLSTKINPKILQDYYKESRHPGKRAFEVKGIDEKIPPELLHVVKKCCTLDPRLRPSMTEVHTMLQNVQTDQDRYGFLDSAGEISFDPQSPVTVRTRESIDEQKTFASNTSMGSYNDRNSHGASISGGAFLSDTKNKLLRNSKTSYGNPINHSQGTERVTVESRNDESQGGKKKRQVNIAYQDGRPISSDYHHRSVAQNDEQYSRLSAIIEAGSAKGYRMHAISKEDYSAGRHSRDNDHEADADYPDRLHRAAAIREANVDGAGYENSSRMHQMSNAEVKDVDDLEKAGTT
mmetsp:Transcript_23407/g.45670  ORF Transcript_23407/g.45670 Transcript_23407/m.45670 type:complete len:354 (-) Transcript_23407:266-1327(-)